jgi:hypothetical protein
VIVFNEAAPLRLMTRYCSSHELSHTHLSLNKDTFVVRSCRLMMAPSSQSRRSTVFIIDTNGRSLNTGCVAA